MFCFTDECLIAHFVHADVETWMDTVELCVLNNSSLDVFDLNTHRFRMLEGMLTETISVL